MKDIITHLNESIKPIFKGNLKKQSPYKVVDLGLSVKWCDCNVGAYKPEDPGLLFQFGRTDGYKYDDENHGFLSEDDYVTTSETEYKHGETLKPEDDAAHVNMGGSWRMPTSEEIDELRSLSHKYTELNGVKGYEITSENGNSIFIPAAGFFYCSGDIFSGQGTTCYLWSSSIYEPPSYVYSAHNYAYRLGFSARNCSCDSYDVYSGLSVRGVCK